MREKNNSLVMSVVINLQQNQALKAHIMEIHKGKRPYKCTKCEATFNYKNAMTRHIANIHDGKKPFKCDVV